jgi:DNA repair protein RadA/Sms
MANLLKNIFVCANCDAQFPKWSGRCLECGAWGTLSQSMIDSKEKEKKEYAKVGSAEVIDLSSVENKDLKRYLSGLGELDRVLGAGLVKGCLLLLGGEPGIGKSTLAAQICQNFSQNSKVIYVSGEESLEQIKNRFWRLKSEGKNIGFIAETNLEKIENAIRQHRPDILIVDSIQTIYSATVPSEAGAVNQIRAATVRFLELAKQLGVSIVLIGHITKDGAVAGPKTLEHIVDAVIYLEQTNVGYILIRAQKNRFGSTSEIGLLEMTGTGLIELKNVSSVFLEGAELNLPGSIVSVIMEGTRPMLVNIQALVSKTIFGYPQRKASGFDVNRLQILAAVLEKKTKLKIATHDIILNVVGGLKVNDPALDLAVCLAIVSSISNIALTKNTIVLGEVGLSGEVRSVAKVEKRISEANNLGFNNALIPIGENKEKKMKFVTIKNISEAIDYLLGK